MSSQGAFSAAQHSTRCAERAGSPEWTSNGIALLPAVRDEIARGWLSSFKGLIVAEVFADFLDMADYLMAQGYKGRGGGDCR